MDRHSRVGREAAGGSGSLLHARGMLANNGDARLVSGHLCKSPVKPKTPETALHCCRSGMFW
jgi:hypothetical protein